VHKPRTPPGPVTVSVGLAALKPEEKKTVEDLLKEADEALYLAKEGGKNRVSLYGN
jgi:diguanylate cyclase (GGDEF)-like protein